ncbi:MAG TPA: MFS transporter [Rubrobacteraceae bacterium]|nr:MFS transporter [Rubrobacteraceae bacterium]
MAGSISAEMRKGVDKRAMAVLSAGHLFTDVNQGAVAALIPFLVAERGLSLAAAGTLVLAATLSSSIVQPIFGYFSDRRPLHTLMPLGVLIGGLGIALAGVAPSYPTILACVVVSGLGVAAFHPESARFANYVSGVRRARGMSLFSVGGNAGFALGPVMTTPLVLYLGLPGALFLALPALLMCLVLFYEMPRLLTFRPETVEASGTQRFGGPDRWGAFARMVSIVSIRSFIYFGLVTFVSSYYIQVLGTSTAFANAALSVMLFAGALGTLTMGPLADRIGRRAVLAGAMLLLAPLIFAFTLSGALAGMVVLAFVGAVTIGTFGVTVVMGQEYLPSRIGVAAGVTLGLSIGIGGLGAPLFGAVADSFGLHTMMLTLAVLPVAGLALCFTLPREQRSDPNRASV